MSSVSSLLSQPSSLPQSSTDAIDNNVKALEKRIADAVKDGTITAQQGKDIQKALAEIQQTLDQGTKNGSLSATDMRQLKQILRTIARALGVTGQAGTQTASGTTQTPNTIQDSDGDNDGSTGVSYSA